MRTSLLAASFGAFFGFTIAVPTAPASSYPTGDNETLADCLGSKDVPVFFLNSPEYAQSAAPYNVALAYSPAVIVIPSTTQHISDAVVCAGKNHVKVQAKSGGHSYASYGLGGQNGSMIIDLQTFQNITVDSETNVATVGGGVRLGNLASGIYNQSKRALPHGTCPGVGIGGHFTHGGYGYSSRAWGLGLDTIVALDAVLANGMFVHATTEEYPDVYYALRGAAESFGIVTTFYLTTQPAPDTVVNFNIQFPGLFASAATAAAAMMHIQEVALNASVVDRKLGLGVYLDSTPIYSVRGTYFGSLEDFNSKIQPELLRTLPTPSSSDVKAYDWIGSLTQLAGGPLVQPTTGYDLHDNFYAKSLVVPESGPFTQSTLESYFQYIIDKGLNMKPASWFSIINLYGGPDSQINVVPASASSYSDRTSLWVLQHYAFEPTTDLPFPEGSVDPFVQGLNDAITNAQPQTQFTAYLNYVDPKLTPEQAHELYYGHETYEKLLKIKKHFDPRKLYWNPQAVGT